MLQKANSTCGCSLSGSYRTVDTSNCPMIALDFSKCTQGLSRGGLGCTTLILWNKVCAEKLNKGEQFLLPVGREGRLVSESVFMQTQQGKKEEAQLNPAATKPGRML